MKNLRMTMNGFPDGFAMISKQGRILYWNPALENITGLKQEEALNLCIWEIQSILMPEIYKDSYLESQKKFWETRKSETLLRAAVDSSRSEEDLVFTKQDGSSVVSKIAAYVTTTGPDKFFVCVVIKDITEQTKRERALENRGNVANHEMRTPLTAIIGFTDLLLEDPEFVLPEKARPLMQIIKDSGSRALAIAEKSLIFDKLEYGDYQIQKKEIETRKFLEKLKKLLRQIELSHGVNINLLLGFNPADRDSKLIFKADPDLLESILENLIKNAAEAADPDNKRVSITVHMQEKITIMVHNYGEIPEEIRPRLFQKRATFGKTNGNGLGLYLSRLIAQAHGGDISFSSENGETLFFVQIPLK